MTDRFERSVSELTKPLNGQFPRPWMTRLRNPMDARVFIVGKNQRNGYPSDRISHKRHLDALFNRNGESCSSLYLEMTDKKSPTRKNTEKLVLELENTGVSDILETNVICYSSPMSADLRFNKHSGGIARGEEIFQHLLQEISPKILIVHGAGAVKNLSKALGTKLAGFPTRPEDICSTISNQMEVIVIPSLSPPPFNKWSSWAQKHFSAIAQYVYSRIGENTH